MAKKKKDDPVPVTHVDAQIPVDHPIPNNVKKYRKEAGLRKVELAQLCGLSERTIYRIEQEQEAFAPTTYYKVRNALNKALKKEGRPEVTIRELFPGLKDE
jgi:DNA-binding XRE family transcriptional regulator